MWHGELYCSVMSLLWSYGYQSRNSAQYVVYFLPRVLTAGWQYKWCQQWRGTGCLKPSALKRLTITSLQDWEWGKMGAIPVAQVSILTFKYMVEAGGYGFNLCSDSISWSLTLLPLPFQWTLQKTLKLICKHCWGEPISGESVSDPCVHTGPSGWIVASMSCKIVRQCLFSGMDNWITLFPYTWHCTAR